MLGKVASVGIQLTPIGALTSCEKYVVLHAMTESNIEMKAPFYLSMPLLHRPHADHDLSPNPQCPSDLPDGPDPPLYGGDVVDDGDGQNSVETIIAERKAQVITMEDLGTVELVPSLYHQV